MGETYLQLKNTFLDMDRQQCAIVRNRGVARRMELNMSYIPAPSIELSAFNIMPGVAFFAPSQWPYSIPTGLHPQVFVATTKITRDANDEVVHVVARPLNYGELDLSGKRIRSHSFSFDYNDTVKMVGSVVNPNDHDDSDCGWAYGSMVKPYWPATTDTKYDAVCDIAIDLIQSSGHTGPDDLDEAGDIVSDALQSILMDAMFRSQRLMGHLGAMSDLNTALHLGTAKITEVPPSMRPDKDHFPNLPILPMQRDDNGEDDTDGDDNPGLKYHRC